MQNGFHAKVPKTPNKLINLTRANSPRRLSARSTDLIVRHKTSFTDKQGENMCDCIEKVNEVIREQYEDPEASINVGFSFGGNKVTVKPSGLAAQYRKKKKDGTFQEKKTTVSIVPGFCPFCGEEYKKEEAAEQQLQPDSDQ
jgi:hypothetical protein